MSGLTPARPAIPSSKDAETKFFVNLFLDAEMPSSPLQGHDFKYPIEHLNAFLQKIKKGEVKEDYIQRLLSKSDKKEAAAGSQAILQAAAMEKLIEEISFLNVIYEEMGKAADLTKLKQDVSQEILKELLKKGQVILPGGYRGSPGHAMIYQLSIDWKNKALVFIVYNSGAGLKYHQEGVNAELTKILKENVLGYQISFDQLGISLDEEEGEVRLSADHSNPLIDFIAELLRPQLIHLPQAIKPNSDNLYQVIFEKIRFLGGKPFNPREFKSNRFKPSLITEQRSGSCTQKSINQLIKGYFSDERDCRAFMYAYKLDALQNYIHYLEQKGLDKDPEHRQLVVKAIRNLARVLVDSLEKLELKKESHKKEIEKFLRDCLLKFETVHAPEEKKQGELVAPSPVPFFQFEYKDSEARLLASEALHEAKRPASESANKTPISLTQSDLLVHLQAIDRGQNCDQIESLKRLCFQFFLKKEKKEEKIRADPERLQKIISLLQKLASNFNNHSPQGLPVYLSLAVLCLQELDRPEYRLSGKNGISPLKLYAPLLFRHIKRIKEVPHLASSLPDFDRLLQRLEKIVGEYTSGENWITYYLQIMSQDEKALAFLSKKSESIKDEEFYKALKKYFKKRNNIDNLDKYLSNYSYEGLDSRIKNLLVYMVFFDEKPRPEELNKLDKAFKLQEQYDEFISKIFIEKYSFNEQTPCLSINSIMGNMPHGVDSIAIDLFRVFYHPKIPIKILYNYLPPNADFGLALNPNLSLPLNESELEGKDAGFSIISIEPAKSSSEIQLSNHDPVIRDAFFNRRAKGCVLENVLGYYLLNNRYLSEKRHQHYLFLSLFQPCFLLEKLESKDGPVFLESFERFFRFSLNFHLKGGEIDSTHVFLFQLAARVYSYTTNKKLKSELAKTLDEYIVKLKGKDKDKALLSELIKIKLLLTVQDPEEKISVEAVVGLKLEMAKSARSSPETVRYKAEKEFDAYLNAKANDVILRKYKEIEKFLPGLMNAHCAELKLNFVAAKAIPDQALIYELILDPKMAETPPKSYRVDLSLGCLIIGDRYLKPLPLSISTSKGYKEVIGKDLETWFDLSDGYYYFQDQSREYRAMDSNPPQLQTKINGAWYSLAATDPQSVKKESPLKNFTAPALYNQSRYQWWFSGKNAYIYDCERSAYVYQVAPHLSRSFQFDPEISSLDDDLKSVGSVDFSAEAKALSAQFSNLESPEFIEIIKAHSGQHLIHLPRYGLTFETAETKPDRITCLIQGKKYGLSPKEQFNFQGFNAYLILKPLDEKGEIDQKAQGIVMVPFQPFVVAKDEKDKKQTEGLHYKLIQDHKHEVKKAAFEKKHEHWWHYNHTERMLHFTLDAQGQLQADSPSDQLYLVYIYMMQGQTELAYALLKKIHLKGTAEEIECAFLLLKRLPALEDEQLHTPMHLAIQTRLLWMLGQVGNSRKKPIELPAPDLKLTDPPEDNGTYARKYHEALTAFYKNLDDVLAEKYRLYLDTLNNIPSAYRLNHSEEHQLLSYYVMGHRALMRSFTEPVPINQEEKEEKRKEREQKARQALCVADYLNQDSEKETPGYDSLLLARFAKFQECSIQYVQSRESAGLLGSEVKSDEKIAELKNAGSIHGRAFELHDKELRVSLIEVLEDTSASTDSTIQVSIGTETQKRLAKELVEAKDKKLTEPLPHLSLTLNTDELKNHFLFYYQALVKEKDVKAIKKAREFYEKAVAHCALLPEKNKERQKLVYFAFLLSVARSPERFKTLSEYEQEQKLKASTDRNYSLAQHLEKYIPEAWLACPAIAMHIPAVITPVSKPLPVKGRKRIDLPQFSQATPLDRKRQAAERKLSAPIEIKSYPHLANIHRLEAQRLEAIKTLEKTLLAERKKGLSIHEEFKREKEWEDRVAAVYAEYIGQIDAEITAFFADDFNNISEKAKSQLEAIKREKEEKEKALKKYFSGFKPLQESFEEMGGLADKELSIEKLLALAVLIRDGDPETLKRYPRLNREHFLETIDAYLSLHFAENWLITISQDPDEDISSRRKRIQAILHYNVSTRLESHILQYVKSIAIYPQQQEQLDSLLGISADGEEEKKEEVSEAEGTQARTVHMPMGAGKTAIIVPTLAAIQAKAGRLVVVQAPAPLLPTVYSDLSKTSPEVFQQRPMVLAFDRNSEASPIALYRIYCLLNDAIAYRHYILTSKSSRDALQMKLNEILIYAAKTPPDPYTQEQIHWLKQINSLLENAYTIIDEAHETYRTRDEMRYTFGQKMAMPNEQIHDLLLFFDAFFKYPCDEKSTFADLIQRDSVLPIPDEKKLSEIMRKFFKEKLLGTSLHPSSREDKAIKALEDFLFNSDDSDPESVKPYLNESEFARILLYRELFQNFIGYVLKKRLFVNYGPAEEFDTVRFCQGLAIPFQYNNVRSPNQFSSYLETAILTIFMLHSLGIDRPTFNTILHDFYERVRIERLQQASALAAASGKLPESEAFEKLFGVPWDRVDPEDEKAMGELFARLKTNPDFITRALRDRILPQVGLYEEELFSDSITHSYRYGQRVLLSGTFRSHRTFDQRVSHDTMRTLAVNGLIRKHINERSNVHILAKQKTKGYIASLMEVKDQGELSAIIDVGAHFNGVSNVEVAQELATVIKGKKPQIQYILFYDTRENPQGLLSALSTSDPTKIIALGNSSEDVLSARLGPPSLRFTYYDQAHTLGTDIRQPVGSRAIITVAKDTIESDLQQGAMRMRDLANTQHLSIVIDPELNAHILAEKKKNAPSNPEAKGAEAIEAEMPSPELSAPDISDFTYDSECRFLIPDQLRAAQYRIFNWVKQDLHLRRMRISDPEKAKALITSSKSFFIRSKSFDARALFNAKRNIRAVKAILQDEANQALENWQKALTRADIVLSEAEMTKMRQHLEELVVRGLKDCEQATISPTRGLAGAEAETETQVEVQVQKELKQEVQVRDPRVVARPIDLDNLKRAVESKHVLDAKNLSFYNYQTILDEKFPGNHLSLYPNMTMTYNYAYTARLDQDGLPGIFSLYGPYTKPIQNLLFIGSEPISVVILVPEEAEYLKTVWEEQKLNERKPLLWIGDISGIPVTGNKPKDMDANPDYQSLMEQLWFLNGNIDQLLLQPKLHWLSKDSEAKIKFYEEHISKAHPGVSIEKLKEKIADPIELYREAQKEIIETGYSEKIPKGANPENFQEYLKAMKFIWDAFASNDAKKINDLKSYRWSLHYGSLSQNVVLLLEEYVEQLEKIHNKILKPDSSLDELLVNFELLLCVYPQESKDVGQVKSMLVAEKYINVLITKVNSDAKISEEDKKYACENLEKLKKDFIEKASKKEEFSNKEKIIYLIQIMHSFRLKEKKNLFSSPFFKRIIDPFSNDFDLFRSLFNLCQNYTFFFIADYPCEVGYNHYIQFIYKEMSACGKNNVKISQFFPNFPEALKKWIDAGLTKKQIEFFISSYILYNFSDEIDDSMPKSSHPFYEADIKEVQSFFDFVGEDKSLSLKELKTCFTEYLFVKQCLREAIVIAPALAAEDVYSPKSTAYLEKIKKKYQCILSIQDPKEQEFFLLLSARMVGQPQKQMQLLDYIAKLYSARDEEKKEEGTINITNFLKMLLPLLETEQLKELLNFKTIRNSFILNFKSLKLGSEGFWDESLMAILLTNEALKSDPWILTYKKIVEELKFPHREYIKIVEWLTQESIKKFNELPINQILVIRNYLLLVNIIKEPKAKNAQRLFDLLVDSAKVPEQQEKIIQVLEARCVLSRGVGIGLSLSIGEEDLDQQILGILTELCELPAPAVRKKEAKMPHKKQELPPAPPIPSIVTSSPTSEFSNETETTDSSSVLALPPPSSIPTSSSSLITRNLTASDSREEKILSEVKNQEEAIPAKQNKEKTKPRNPGPIHLSKEAPKTKPSSSSLDWIKITLGLLSGTTAGLFAYSLTPQFLLLITSSLSLASIAPILLMTSTLILGLVALYLIVDGFRNSLSSSHSKLPRYLVGFFGLAMGMAFLTFLILGIHFFPLMPLLCTVFAIITPIALGVYCIIRTARLLPDLYSVKKASVGAESLSKQQMAQSSSTYSIIESKDASNPQNGSYPSHTPS